MAMKTYSCLNVHYKILYYLGFFPPAPDSSRITRKWHFFCPRFFIVRFAYAPILHVFGANHRWDDPVGRTEELILIMMWFFMFITFSGLFLKRTRLAGLFAELDGCGDDDDDDDACNEIRCRCTEHGEKKTKFLLTAIISASVVFTWPMYWLAFTTRSIPLRSWMPVDVSTSPLFEVVALFTITSGVVDIMALPICDTLLVSIIKQLTARLQVLRYKIENSHELVKTAILREATAQLKDDRHDAVHDYIVHQDGGAARARVQYGGERRKQEFDTRMEEFLGKRVRTHYAIIGLIRETQKTFNHSLHCQMALNMCMAVMVLYVTTVADEFSTEGLICIIISVFGASGFHDLCLAGHELTEENEGLRESCYSSAWPQASERFKRDLRIIMCRAERPVLLRAAGLRLNLNTFRMATRVSYYMHKVLANIFHGKKINTRS